MRFKIETAHTASAFDTTTGDFNPIVHSVTHALQNARGSNRFVLVFLSGTTSQVGNLTFTGVTYDGVAPTGSLPLINPSIVGKTGVQVFYFNDAALPATTGNKTVAATQGNNGGNPVGSIFIVEITGIDQVLPFAHVATSATNFGVAQTYTPGAGDLQFGHLTSHSAGGGTSPTTSWVSDSELYDITTNRGGVIRGSHSIGYSTDGSITGDLSSYALPGEGWQAFSLRAVEAFALGGGGGLSYGRGVYASAAYAGGIASGAVTPLKGWGLRAFGLGPWGVYEGDAAPAAPTGTGVQTLAMLVQAASSLLTLTATGSQDLAATTQDATAAAGTAGSGVQDLSATVQSAAGEQGMIATASSVVPAVVQDATGVLLLAATGAQTLSTLVQSATAEERMQAAAQSALAALTQVASGQSLVLATGSMQIPMLGQTANADLSLSGTSAQTLAALLQAGIGVRTVAGTASNRVLVIM